ncbi:hypothetical protein LOTGIDRAFT_129913, partial [Lottia gigantea]
LATATSKFSLDLYNKFSIKNKNLIISPFSVFTALAMVSLGSKGQTMDEIYKTLNIQHLGDDVHQAFHYYTSLLQGLTNVTLNNANGMFVKPGTQLLPEFSNKMKQFYDAKVQEFDFSNPKGPEAPINDWVSKQTAGMIKDFLKPGSVDGNTIMWLINAIYFKGTWKNIFNERLTRKQKFHVSKTTQVDVDMMTLSEKMFRYKRLDNLKTTVMELPYVGDRYSMYILLPDDIEGLSTLESSLDATSLESALTSKNSHLLSGMDKITRFIITMPKFSLGSSLKLNQPLQDLGLNKIFDGRQADLSGITGKQNLVVNSVIQKAVIDVTESGTRAAAVTGIGIVLTSSVHLPPRYLRIDHPFMFAIRDKQTNTNLFMGRYTDPRSA